MAWSAMRPFLNFFLVLPMLLPFAEWSVAAEESSLIVNWKSAIRNDDTVKLQSLLQTARSSANPEITPSEVLIRLRADTGKTALMIACKLGDQTLVDELIELGADIHAKTKTGGTPIMFASLGGHIELVRFLAGQQVNINAQGANGWSATTIAAAKGFAPLLSLLIELGADINARDVYRWTPLMRAVDNRHDNAVRVLLAQTNVELDAGDDTGNTALHHAAANGDVLILEQLLIRGADPAIKNDGGFLATHLAAASPNAVSLLKLLSSD